MANRYWVGGSGNWSSTSHWSTSSGGSSGASVPSTSDDVFIDSNSGFGSGGTITLDEQAFANDLICTSGHTYTLNHDSTFGFSIYGSLTFESGITNNNKIYFYSTSTDETVTTDGVTINGDVYFLGAGGKWTLQDDLVIVGEFYQQNGTVDANDHNVTANDFYFYADTGYTPTVIMGSGTWEVSAADKSEIWVIDENSGEVVTINCETSTIKINGYGNYGRDFYGAGKTYHNLWLLSTGDGKGSFTIFGSNTFNEIKSTELLTYIYFDNGTTTTVNSFNVSGSAGNLNYLGGYWGSVQWNISKSSGIVSCDYLDISNSNATGGATWYAGSHSVDTANNDGWIFDDAPTEQKISPLPTHFNL